jgi:hypothetical protein
LQSIHISDGVTRIGRWAFEDCISLKNLLFPDSVISVDEDVFGGCTSLQSVRIPGNMTSVGKEAFDICACDHLQSLISPKIPIEAWDSTLLKLMAAFGYLQNRELFLDTDIAATYKKYALSQRKKLLPTILRNDAAEALAFYADEKKITSKNFEAEYLNPAREMKAKACVKFLLDWQSKKIKKST